MLLKFLKIRKSRLSFLVVSVAFVSILIIEVILLIPSIIRREKQLLNQIEEITEGKVSVLTQISVPSGIEESDEEIYEQLSNLVKLKEIKITDELKHIIVGGSFYTSDGKLIGSFGEKPQLSFLNFKRNPKKSFRSQDGTRYDVGWTAKQMGRDTFLIVRHNTASLQPEINAYILRIAGLVVLISIFVTGGVWIALEPIVIRPILCLRNDLIKAGEAISKDKPSQNFASAPIKRKDELGDVITAFDTMYHQISTAYLQRKRAEAALQVSLTEVENYSQALNQELEKGREMQLNFLPADERIKCFADEYNWEIASFFQPARQVAGDFYDIFELDNGSVGFVIADVCDKGVGAALFMALFRSLIRIFSGKIQLRGQAKLILEQHLPQQGWIGESPLTNLAHLNSLQAVCLTNEYVSKLHGELGMFATLFFGVLEPDTGLLTYINAGHEPLFIISSDGKIIHQLESTAPAVGMLPNISFPINQIFLHPGEILIGYTDGVTEARNCNSEFFTDKKLISLLEQPIDSAKELLNQITTAIKEHTGDSEQFDDITLLALQRKN
ncbi:MAG: SpoIIE family protein phosphatase [Rivularia sp. (in: Bacteria)]|nr:SpoIIE family protein phosphatase [Rivularia sp. MS3]